MRRTSDEITEQTHLRLREVAIMLGLGADRREVAAHFGVSVWRVKQLEFNARLYLLNPKRRKSFLAVALDRWVCPDNYE